MSLLQDDKEKLIGNQKKLDVNNSGDIDAGDFKLLRKEKQEGGPMMMDEPVSLPEEQEQDMLPKAEPMMDSDEVMEDEYLDFILDEALDEEEEDFLMEQLEANEELSIIFDKVIEVASEFAGSGSVIGPGSGVSDSIPARLSDGEFVFTAKAAKEIGADELMRMMKDAEMRADKRQGMANGGEMEEDTVTVEATDPDVPTQVIRVERPNVGPEASMQEEEDLVKQNIITRGMSGKPSPVS